VDLNRDFPSIADPDNTTSGRARETAAVMDWTAQHRFVASISFHSGSLGAVYPWGHAASLPLREQNPETALFRTLCLDYAAGNPGMWARNDYGWEHGTRNAGDWYPVLGEMADWNYRWYGCLEVTVELSDIKAPANPGFDSSWSYWEANRDAMLAFLRAATGGVRGFVRGADGAGIEDARLAPGRLPVPTNGDVPVRAICRLHVFPGWNLISLPLHPDEPAPADIFPNAAGYVWEWRTDHYETALHIRPYHPVWVYAESGADLEVPGVAAEDADRTALTRGWNLVGVKGTVTLNTAFADVPAVSAQAVAWDPEAGQYTWVGPTESLDPTRGYWFFVNADTWGDLTEGPADACSAAGSQRPCASRADPDTGMFFRLLAPGRWSLWFKDVSAPRIVHTPPETITPGAAVVLNAQVHVPAAPLQVFGIDVPGAPLANGLPAHTEFDPDLPAGNAVCRVLWSDDGGGAWTETALTPSGSTAAWSVTLPSLASGGVRRYYFELTQNGVTTAALGDAREPFTLQAVPAGRAADVLPVSVHPASGEVRGAGHSWSEAIIDAVR